MDLFTAWCGRAGVARGVARVVLRSLVNVLLPAMLATNSASGSAAAVDLVVTRYREPLQWVRPYLERPGWRVYIYNTGRKPPPPRICQLAALCEQVPNAGYEWHGYLRHVSDRYERLADLTIFTQGDPFTVSPDMHCLLNQTQRFAPLQVLSWVQQAKRKMEIFSQCRASHVGGCRVWIEPVTAALRPMLHGDRWLHRACRMAKRFKGGLFQWLYTQLTAPPSESVGPAEVHRGLIARQAVPPKLYRAYGAQFAAARAVLRERPPEFYARLLKWLTTHHDDMGKAGFLPVWRAYTTKEKAILLELIWMSLFRAERFVAPDVCAACLQVAASLPRPADAYSGGPRCDRDYFTGAPRVEACNVTGDGWGGPPSKRLKMRCPITKNDDEVAAG